MLAGGGGTGVWAVLGGEAGIGTGVLGTGVDVGGGGGGGGGGGVLDGGVIEAVVGVTSSLPLSVGTGDGVSVMSSASWNS